jgi:signal transduction histidine kinase
VIRRLRNLVRLGQSEAGPYRLEQIIAEARELVALDFEQRRLSLRSRLPAELPLLLVDRIQIEQVLYNLIRNAVEAAERAGHGSVRVTIEASVPTTDSVEVVVRDSGPGFPAGTKENELLPFISGKPNGLGVGLTLCRRIVEAHGGRLWIEPGAPGGAVHFTLRTVHDLGRGQTS